MRAAARVMVAVADVTLNDRLVRELQELGVDPTPVFSVGEATVVLGRERFDALLVEEGAEETAEPFRRWLKAHFKGVVVFVRSYDEGADGEEAAEAALMLAKALRRAGMMG